MSPTQDEMRDHHAKWAADVEAGKCIICGNTAVPTTRYCGGDTGCQSGELSEKQRLTNLFAMATDRMQVLGYLAGFASMCWKPTPSTAEFDSSAAKLAVDIANERLQELK